MGMGNGRGLYWGAGYREGCSAWEVEGVEEEEEKRKRRRKSRRRRRRSRTEEVIEEKMKK